MFLMWKDNTFTLLKEKDVCYDIYVCYKYASGDDGGLVTKSCLTLVTPMDGLSSARLLCLWNSLGKNNGGGSHSFLQGIFPTQGSNPDLLHRRWILY